MKTKSMYKRALICVFIFSLMMVFSTTVVAAVSLDDVADLNVALQEIGLSLEVAISPQRHDITSISHDGILHIGRLSADTPIQIVSETDVGVLLAFAQMATEQQLHGFSWDACVDIAIAEAGLEDFWDAEFRRITQAARNKSIIDLAMNYSVEEIAEMGLFNRVGILEEFQSLGFFRHESIVHYNLNIGYVVPFNVQRIIPHQILYAHAWQSNFTLLVGDRVTYSIQFALNAGFPNVRVATGVARRGMQGVGNFRDYPVLLYPWTASRTFHVTFTLGGEVFGIQPGGGNTFWLNGTYRVTW